jgi:hypothetical protein
MNYLVERARGFKDTQCDYVRGAEKRLEKLPVDKGLLRETEAVQHQITALLKCDVRTLIEMRKNIGFWTDRSDRFWITNLRMRLLLQFSACYSWIC